MDHLNLSEHRHHRSHLSIHPSYIYNQLLIQDTPGSTNQTPIYDLVKNVYKPDKAGSKSDSKGGSATAITEEVDIATMMRRGFLSIFIVPSMNILITVTHPYYDCPASRLVVRSAHLDMSIPGQMDIACNAELLGISMIHRSVGYASNVVRIVDKRLRDWEEQMRSGARSIKTEEAHRLVVELQDFKSRFKPLRRVVDKLRRHYEQEREYEIDEYRLVFEETEGLLEKSKHLESYCFNMLSTRTNDSMERLAIVTIVFLPLTFIASYFSMGFEQFADLTRPPIYFWQISIPLSFAFFLIFAYSILKRGLIRLMHLLKRLRRWTKKQTKWWKADIELWWRKKRGGWSGRDGRKDYERTTGQP